MVDLFNGYNLKLFLAGHVHVYEKIEIEEITYVIGGAVSGFWWKGPMGKTEQGFVVVNIGANNKFSVEYQSIR